MRAVDAPLPRTLWYMGAKGRVLPGLLGPALEREVPVGGTVVDLMSGTGIVSAFCARRWRVYANDAQAYSHIIARSLIEHDPRAKRGFVRSVDPIRDLRRAYDENFALLERHYAPALRSEDELLARAARGDVGAGWCRDYRAFLARKGGLHGALPSRAGPYARAGTLLADRAIDARRRDPLLRPACLMAAYYANVYFGLRQSLALDSLRAAIDDLDGASPHASARRTHYLAALLHAASVSTSGTSHFAQPRHTRKDSELRAMAGRRALDVFALFETFSREILTFVEGTSHAPGNRSFHGDYRLRLKGDAGAGRLDFPRSPDLVYLDPPYTADNYSRFYHVLEVLAAYDYPPLERDARGGILRGRYPAIDRRFQSGFCSPGKVEGEFRRVAAAASASGAKLIVSYSSPTGLLLRRYARESASSDPVTRMERLFEESYRHVTALRLALTHSGQGEGGRQIDELVFICREPR